jgi:hypothetical protein
MIQATGTPIGDEPPGDETRSAIDVPLDRPAEQVTDTDTPIDTDADDGPDRQQRDRYQPL